MNSMISTINYGISNINYSISGIEAAMNFGPWEVPTATGSRIIDSMHLFHVCQMSRIWHLVQ